MLRLVFELRATGNLYRYPTPPGITFCREARRRTCITGGGKTARASRFYRSFLFSQLSYGKSTYLPTEQPGAASDRLPNGWWRGLESVDRCGPCGASGDQDGRPALNPFRNVFRPWLDRTRPRLRFRPQLVNLPRDTTYSLHHGPSSSFFFSFLVHPHLREPDPEAGVEIG